MIRPHSRDGSRRVFRNWFTIGILAVLLGVDGFNWAYNAGAGAELSTLTALVGLVLIIMMFRPAIIVTDDHVMVRGLIRTRTESWSNVAGFGFGRAHPLNRRAYIEVQLTDGSRLRTPGLTVASNTSKFALRTIADLEGQRTH